MERGMIRYTVQYGTLPADEMRNEGPRNLKEDIACH